MFGYRVWVEKSVLIATFGQGYVAYQRTTRRMIPLIYEAANGGF